MTLPTDPTPYVPGGTLPPSEAPLLPIDGPRRPGWTSNNRLVIAIGAIVAIAILLGGLVAISVITGVGPAANLLASPLAKAQQKCDPGIKGSRLADDDKTLILDGVGKENGTGLDIDAAACIFKELGVTTAVIEHVDHTRALDGRQTDSWGRFKAAWTYHPDDGLNLVIQES